LRLASDSAIAWLGFEARQTHTKARSLRPNRDRLSPSDFEK